MYCSLSEPTLGNLLIRDQCLQGHPHIGLGDGKCESDLLNSGGSETLQILQYDLVYRFPPVGEIEIVRGEQPFVGPGDGSTGDEIHRFQLTHRPVDRVLRLFDGLRDIGHGDVEIHALQHRTVDIVQLPLTTCR